MKKTIIGFCVLGLVALCGCSSSSDGDVLDNPSQPLDADDVNEAVQDILVPALQMLDMSGFFDDKARASILSKAGTMAGDCEPLDGLCDSGTVEACPHGDGVAFDFDSCLVEGELWNGRMTMTLSSLTSGSMAFNVTVGPATITGEVSFSQADSCVIEVVNNFGFSIGDVSSYMDANLEYCLGANWPDGSAAVSVTDPGFGSYSFELGCDGTSTASLIIRDLLAGDAMMATCTVNLDAGTASCEFV